MAGNAFKTRTPYKVYWRQWLKPLCRNPTKVNPNFSNKYHLERYSNSRFLCLNQSLYQNPRKRRILKNSYSELVWFIFENNIKAIKNLVGVMMIIFVHILSTDAAKVVHGTLFCHFNFCFTIKWAINKVNFSIWMK